MRRNAIASLTLLSAALIAVSPALHAQEKVHGKVTTTKLTACDMNEKGGACEGYMMLQADGHKDPMKILVKKSTRINKGKEHLFLPALRGSMVNVGYVQDQGEKLARTVEVLPKK